MAEEQEKNYDTLRRRAEEKVVARAAELAELFPGQDPEYVNAELQIYQVELEMQNDELRQAQHELAEARDRYADLYDFAPTGYFVLDEMGRILGVNLTGTRQLGVDRSRLKHSLFSDYVAWDSQDTFYLHRRRVLETKTRQMCELKLKRPDGSHFYGQLESVAVPCSPPQLRTALIDISERKQLEEALAVSADISRQLTAILDWDELLSATVNLVWQAFDCDLVVLELLEPETRLLAHAAAAGVKVSLDRQTLDHTLASEALLQEEAVVVPDLAQEPRYSVSYFPEARSALGMPLKFREYTGGALTLWRRRRQHFATSSILAIQALSYHIATALENARLVADLKRTQAQLVQQERLAVLGQIAATVAHELRNPLMGIRMGVEYFVKHLGQHDPHRRGAKLIQGNIERIDRIVETILFMARVPQPTFRPERFRTVVEQELGRWVDRLAEKKINARLELAPDLPVINVDADQLGRAISNLIDNSFEVMPRGGSLYLKLYAENGYQVLIVADDGPGIPPEQLGHIFEPFFTTKTRGTGLGLAIAKQVVEQHHGTITVWSENGAGTRFTIRLPGS